MSDKKDGGPAFPVPVNEYKQQDQGWSVYPTGMTLRDYFAGQVLTNLKYSIADIISADSSGRKNSDDVYYAIAKTSYKLADAMIAERER